MQATKRKLAIEQMLKYQSVGSLTSRLLCIEMLHNRLVFGVSILVDHGFGSVVNRDQLYPPLGESIIIF